MTNTRFHCKGRTKADATYDERMDIINNNHKGQRHFPFRKTSARHWPIQYKYPNYQTRRKPLYKLYHGEFIKLAEYKYLVNYFKYKGLTFSYPIEKIKFINEEAMEQVKKLAIL